MILGHLLAYLFATVLILFVLNLFAKAMKR